MVVSPVAMRLMRQTLHTQRLSQRAIGVCGGYVLYAFNVRSHYYYYYYKTSSKEIRCG